MSLSEDDDIYTHNRYQILILFNDRNLSSEALDDLGTGIVEAQGIDGETGRLKKSPEKGTEKDNLKWKQGQ